MRTVEMTIYLPAIGTFNDKVILDLTRYASGRAFQVLDSFNNGKRDLACGA
jgi:hypothetical protein